MSKERILKQLVIPSVTVNCLLLNITGPVDTGDASVADEVILTLKKSDFENEEEYHQVMRILTQTARLKVTDNVEKNV